MPFSPVTPSFLAGVVLTSRAASWTWSTALAPYWTRAPASLGAICDAGDILPCRRPVNRATRRGSSPVTILGQHLTCLQHVQMSPHQALVTKEYTCMLMESALVEAWGISF